MTVPEQKTMRYAISTLELDELAARCQRFEDLRKRTVMDFIQNDGPLPLSLLQTGWQEAIGHLLVTGFEEVLPKFVERSLRDPGRRTP